MQSVMVSNNIKRTVFILWKNIKLKHYPPIAIDVVKLINVDCLKGNSIDDLIRKVQRYYNLDAIFFWKIILNIINEFIGFINTNFQIH